MLRENETWKLLFVINPYRKFKDIQKIDGTLTPYWDRQYRDMFRKW